MRLRVVALLLLAASVLTVLTEPPATAAHRWSRLALSSDGRHWSPTLSGPLFRGDFVWVPGSSRVATFYVKNRSRGTALLRVTVHTADPTGWLRDNHVRLALRHHRRHWVRIHHAGNHGTRSLRVRRGEVVPVQVRFRMLRSARNHTRNRHLNFSVDVRLSQQTSRH